MHSFSFKHSRKGHRASQDRGLRIFGELQRVFRTFEAKLGNGKSERIIGGLEGLPCRRIFIGQLLAHARILAGLAGEHKGDLHDCPAPEAAAPSWPSSRSMRPLIPASEYSLATRIA